MPSLNLQPATVSDYRTLAERRVPRGLFDYLDGGAGEEVSLRQNATDFENLRLRQRVLRDVSKIDTSTSLFGTPLKMPLILAPVGMAGMMARRAEVQAKRAADKAGIPFCLSTVGICPAEEVAAVSEAPFWFQLYMLRDRGIVKEMLDHVWAQGVRTLVFTVDLAVLGARYRDVRNGLTGGLSGWKKLRAGPVDYALHPHWLYHVALRGRPHHFGNIARYVRTGGSVVDFQQWLGGQFDASVTWKDIAWLRTVWNGTLVLKGILDPEDARETVKVGADGMIVSNHGGRQLDGVSSGIAMLPRIADAVGSETTLLVDGGVRNGQDVVKALANGAKAALIGRPWVYAVAGAGQAGLERMLSAFRHDIATALGLTGFPRAVDVDGSALDSGA